jgi:uncharacterized membrane protein YkvA (DUF1232 family)
MRPRSGVRLASKPAVSHILFMAFARTFWRGEGAGNDNADLRRDFWRKLRGIAARLPFAEDLLAAYYCAFDRETPLPVKAALVGALAYFVLPVDVIPDVLPVLGFTDDAAVLATAIKLVSSHIRPEHRDAAKDKLDEMVNSART